MLKTVFFGTPDVAVPFLEILSKCTEVKLVVTQPDRPKGRGLVLTPCPVKQFALEHNLPVASPEKLKDFVPNIAALNADIGICVAYGKIFRKPALDALKQGIVNIHFSVLPKYRGASPVQSALMAGETKTGITLFSIDEGMDTGPVIAVRETDILPQDNSQTLFKKLTEIAADALKDFLQKAETQTYTKTPQSGEPTFAPLISKEQTFITFEKQTATQINNLVRALASGAPSFAKAVTPEGQIVQIIKTSLTPPAQNIKNGKPGAVVSIERKAGFFVQCIEGVLLVETVRPAGKNLMPAFAYINGKKLNEENIIFK